MQQQYSYVHCYVNIVLQLLNYKTIIEIFCIQNFRNNFSNEIE